MKDERLTASKRSPHTTKKQTNGLGKSKHTTDNEAPIQSLRFRNFGSRCFMGSRQTCCSGGGHFILFRFSLVDKVDDTVEQ